MIDNGIPEELATVMEGGFLTGRDSQGGGNGIRLVGGPIGDTSYAKSFVNDLVEKHAVRLGDLAAFGKSCRYIKPHEAVQLLRFCAVPRINHLVQIDCASELSKGAFRYHFNPSANCRNSEAHDDA